MKITDQISGDTDTILALLTDQISVLRRRISGVQLLGITLAQDITKVESLAGILIARKITGAVSQIRPNSDSKIKP